MVLLVTRTEREQRGQEVQSRVSLPLRVTLPVPPSVNGLYSTVRGHRVLSKAGRQYHKDAGWLTKEAAAVIGFDVQPLQRLELAIVLHWPDNRRRDLSNAVKCLEDSLAAALGFDDSTIDLLTVKRGEMDRSNPRAEVELRVAIAHGGGA